MQMRILLKELGRNIKATSPPVIWNITRSKIRTWKNPPGTKERFHIPKEVTGNIEQLLEDVKKWPHEPVSWSTKAKEYSIRENTNETTPPNGGWILKEFLKSEEWI